MNTTRTLLLAGFAFVTSIAGAYAATGNPSTRIPMVKVYSQSEGAYSVPGLNLLGLNRGSEDVMYTLCNKAPHNGFDLYGNGVNPPIGPITD